METLVKMSNIKKLKPDTPSRRYMSVSTFDDITKSTPDRKLTVALRKQEEGIIQAELLQEEGVVDISVGIE